MRGQPDLLFWRIESPTRSHSHSSETTSHVNGENDREYDSGISKSRLPEDSRSSIKMASEDGKLNDTDEGGIGMHCAHSVFAVEVKSATDRLSEWQSAWLSLLSEAGVHSEEFKITG